MKLRLFASKLSNSKKIVHASTVMLACSTLAGCLISPYYGQKFETKSAAVPFTVWTSDKTKPIVFECAKASANGNPFGGEGSYQHLMTVWPDNQGQLDPDGNKIYSASKSQVIPENCWRYYDFPDQHDYITVVRMLQDGSASGIYVFDKPGLECLGEWLGKGADWFSWMSHGCYKTYWNTGGTIRSVFLKSKL